MSTFADLKTAIARDLRDPDNVTFPDDGTLGDLALAGMSEVARISPRFVQDDITPLADTLYYDLLTTDFPDGEPGIDVVTVEIWDTSVTPDKFVRQVPPRATAAGTNSQGGWWVWNGRLNIPGWAEAVIDPDIHIIRIWCYAPYIKPLLDADILTLTWEQEQAVRAYARVEALQRLLASRELYSQWQTRAGNTDISPAGLMNALSLAQAEWDRRSKKLVVLREAP